MYSAFGMNIEEIFLSLIKQAGDTARISDEFKLSTNRIRIESDVLQLEEVLITWACSKGIFV